MKIGQGKTPALDREQLHRLWWKARVLHPRTSSCASLPAHTTCSKPRVAKNVNYAAALSALLGPLDEAAKGLILRKLRDSTPSQAAEQGAWFDPYFEAYVGRREHYSKMAENLQKTLLYGNGISSIGLLRSCLDFALNDKARVEGVFEAVRERVSLHRRS